MKLTLDLHDIYDQGAAIDRALQDVIDQAVRTHAKVVEIIPGKDRGSCASASCGSSTART